MSEQHCLYSVRAWERYAVKLEEYASGKLVGGEQHLAYGTCRYCEYSSPELEIPAYSLFAVLEDKTHIAAQLTEMYQAGEHGRTPARIRLAAELAAYIRKEILNAR